MEENYRKLLDIVSRKVDDKGNILPDENNYTYKEMIMLLGHPVDNKGNLIDNNGNIISS